MAMPQRVGRAVLELNVDKAQYSSGLTEATKEQQAFGATVQRTYRDMVQGMSAAARQQEQSTRLIVGMAQAGRQAAMELQKASTLSRQIASGMSGRGFTAQIQQQRKELDALARGMNVAGKEATASSRMIAGMGASGKLAAAGLAQTTQQLTLSQRAAGLLKSTWVQMAAGFTIANVISGAARSLVGLGREAFESAGHISDLRSQTGLTATTIQRMQFVAKQTGKALDDFTGAAYTLGVNLAGGDKSVVAALQSVGLSLAEIQRLNPSQQFETVVAALSKVGSETERNRIGQELFGRSFKNIAAAVGQGYDDIARHAKTSSDAQIDALDRAADRWQQFVDNSKAGVQSFLGNQLLLQDAMRQVEAEARKQGRHLGDTERLAMAERLMQASLAPGAPAARGGGGVVLPTAPPRDYARALADARQELAKLTAAQRAEVLAAQTTGATEEELAEVLERFKVRGVSTQLALSILAEKHTEVAEKVLENATKYGTLTSALVATQLQIANLESWQRKDIDAGIALGASTDDIAKKMGLAKEVVAGYADQVKASTERTADLEKNLRELVKAANDAANLKGLTIGARVLQDATAANLAQRGTGDTFRRIALQRAEFEAEAAENAGASWQQVFVLQQRVGRMRLEEDKRLAAREFAIATTGLDQTSTVYEQMAAEHNAKIQEMTEAFEQGEVLKRDALKRTHDVWRQRWAAFRSEIVGGTSDAVGEMLVGLRGFKDGFLDIWTSIRRSVANVLSGMVNDFLTGYLKRLTGSAVAGLVPGLGGGAGGGLLGTAANVGGTAALGGLFGGGASAGLGTLSLGAATTSVAAVDAAAIAAGAAATGTAAAGTAAAVTAPAAGGLGATIAGLATNPFTIAAAAALGGFVLWKKFGKSEESKEVSPRRAQFWAQVGGFAAMGSKLTQALIRRGVPDAGNKASGMLAAVDAAKQLTAFRAAEDPIISAFRLAGITNVKKFNMGGFVPPGITQPAILHGGRRGEYVIPADKLDRHASAPPVSINKFEFSIHAMDGADVSRVFESHILPRIKKAVRHNQDGLVTEMRMRVPRGSVR